MNNYTTLILGAGSSADFGIPLGYGLKRYFQGDFELQLNELCKNQYGEILLSEYEIYLNDAERIHKLFDTMNFPSIDNLISYNPRLATTAKIGISMHLGKAVKNCDIKSINTDWVSIFFHKYLAKITADSDISKVDFSNLKIITFNYENIFKNRFEFLLNHFTEKLSAEEVSKYINSLEIKHVYGELNLSSFNNTSDYRNFDNHKNASNDIYAIFEERDVIDDSYLNILRNSSNIYILGFDFDEYNCNKIFFNQKLISLTKSLTLYCCTYKFGEHRYQILKDKLSNFDLFKSQPQNKFYLLNNINCQGFISDSF